MTDAQFIQWMGLNMQYKKGVFLVMNLDDQLDCLDRVTALDGGERFCGTCPYWTTGSDGYGTCNCSISKNYNQKTNTADGCYLSQEVDELMDMLNEATKSQIKYSAPS